MNILLSLIFLSTLTLSYAQNSEVDEFSEFDNEEVSSQEKKLNWSGMFEAEEGEYISLKKIRFQFENTLGDKGGIFSKTDFIHDDMTFNSKIDVRELRLQYKLNSWLDISLGRQISTWGVADMLFINDLFPKNWLANFQGRDMEMLKDPSNTLRLTAYGTTWTTDLVYTPKFSADTFPRGCYFPTFDPNTSKVGLNEKSCGEYKANDSSGTEIENGEVALSIKRKIKNHELSFYFYEGHYKTPKGVLSTPALVGIHPRLNVYGISDEGQWGPGVFSFEVGYYESKEDQNGEDFFIENSKLKYLVGYKMDLSSSFSYGVQWYQEKMQNYGNYEDSVFLMNPEGYEYRRSEYQNTFTLRLTYKAMQDTLYFSLFSYQRPEDKDSFTKIEVSKKITDEIKITTGVNIFNGKDNYSDREFGMLKDEDNAFVRLNMNF